MDELEFKEQFSKMSYEQIMMLYKDCKDDNVLKFTPFNVHFKNLKYVQIMSLFQQCKSERKKTFDLVCDCNESMFDHLDLEQHLKHCQGDSQ